MTKEKNEISIISQAEKQLTAALAEKDIKVEQIKALTKATKDIKVKDNDSYEEAKEEKRKYVKFRTSGVSVYEDARKGFNAAAKFVIEKQREYEAIIAEGEDPLAEQITAWDAKIKAEKDAEIEAQRIRAVGRINQLTALGAMEDAMTKEMFLDVVRYQKYEIETCEDESFAIILNLFKEKKIELNYEEEQKQLRLTTHNDRLNELQPYWAFLSEETRLSNLADLSQDEFGAMLTIGIKEKNDFDTQKKAIDAQKAEIIEQKKIIRKDYLIGKGFTVGNVAILGYGKQYPLTFLDYTLYSDESFEIQKSVFEDVINEYKNEQQKIAAKQLVHQNRCNELIQLGFKDTGNTLVYENYITVSKTVMDIQENFETDVLDCKRLIQEYKEKQDAIKKQADEEEYNALSDKDKFDMAIGSFNIITIPECKSKKYVAKVAKMKELRDAIIAL